MYEPENISTPTRKVACTAVTAAGTSCTRAAALGQDVCSQHGATAPSARQSAQLRLMQLIDPALMLLAHELTNPNATPATRLRAAENILDRGGLPRTNDTTTTDNARSLLAERLNELAARNTPPPASPTSPSPTSPPTSPTSPDDPAPLPPRHPALPPTVNDIAWTIAPPTPPTPRRTPQQMDAEEERLYSPTATPPDHPHARHPASPPSPTSPPSPPPRVITDHDGDGTAHTHDHDDEDGFNDDE